MTDVERYRLAWLSARQGRKAWRRLYIWAVAGPEDRQGLRFLGIARLHAREVRRLTDEVARLERVHAETLAALDVLGDDHVLAWHRVRELESELRGLLLAFSELQGAQAGQLPSDE